MPNCFQLTDWQKCTKTEEMPEVQRYCKIASIQDFTSVFQKHGKNRALELDHTDSMLHYSAMCLKVVNNFFSVFHVEAILSPWPSAKMDAQQCGGTIAKPKAHDMTEGKLFKRWLETASKHITNI